MTDSASIAKERVLNTGLDTQEDAVRRVLKALEALPVRAARRDQLSALASGLDTLARLAPVLDIPRTRQVGLARASSNTIHLTTTIWFA